VENATHQESEPRRDGTVVVAFCEAVGKQDGNVEPPSRVRGPLSPPAPACATRLVLASTPRRRGEAVLVVGRVVDGTESRDPIVEVQDDEDLGQARAMQCGEEDQRERRREAGARVSCVRGGVDSRVERVQSWGETAGEEAVGAGEGDVEEHEGDEEGQFRPEEVVLVVAHVLRKGLGQKTSGECVVRQRHLLLTVLTDPTSNGERRSNGQTHDLKPADPAISEFTGVGPIVFTRDCA
jgi:hypothetical protein